jgi:endonuclease-3
MNCAGHVPSAFLQARPHCYNRLAFQRQGVHPQLGRRIWLHAAANRRSHPLGTRRSPSHGRLTASSSTSTKISGTPVPSTTASSSQFLISAIPKTGMKTVNIVRICTVLQRVYRSPRHGNKCNPLDELIYIILSTRTKDRSFRTSFARLKTRFRSWNRVDQRSAGVLERVLVPGGLGRLKTKQILGILKYLRAAFGRATLSPLAQMKTDQAEEVLTMLPGVGRKVAKCVLMYSLRRKVLPVDVHVHRIAKRLGFLVKNRPDTSQDLIEHAVPPNLRYSFHVNAIAHGRTICLPRAPRCGICPISKWCAYYRNRSDKP